MDRKNTAFDNRMSLLQLASVRRSVWNAKASHPRLLHMEMVAHQSACHEYNIDILKHLINLENQTRSSWASFQSQPELTVEMRTLIFDFIMCCHTRLRLSSSTLFLCYNIVDRYCSKIIVKSATYQLLGLTALWLASKFADKKPRIPSLQSLCCHQYSKQQFKDVELHILKSLNWSVCSAPTHDSFVDILLKTKIGNLDFRDLNLNDLKYGATILCELSCFDPNLNFNYNASAIALASVTIITCALRLDTKNEFQYVQDCTDDLNLVTICKLLLVQLESEERFPSSFNLKYSTKAGGLQTNPIVNCLFTYYRRLQQEEMRLAEQDTYTLEQHMSSAYDSGVCSSIEYSRKRGCTPLENLSPTSTSSGQLPAIKNFVPPTPTTPNNTLSSMPPYAKNSTHMPSSLTPNASSTAVVAMVAPMSDASTGKRNGAYQTQQRTPPGASQFHPNHSKRNSSMMDIDFFDINQVAVKRLR